MYSRDHDLLNALASARDAPAVRGYAALAASANPERVADADAYLLDWATQHAWDAPMLVAFSASILGREFGLIWCFATYGTNARLRNARSVLETFELESARNRT